VKAAGEKELSLMASLGRVLVSLLTVLVSASALSAPTEFEVPIYLFWGEGCPYCEAAMPHLKQLAASDPRVELREFEVYNSSSNQQLFQEMAALYGFQARSVPTIFIGDRYWVGFAEPLKAEMEQQLKRCFELECLDPGSWLAMDWQAPTFEPYPPETEGGTELPGSLTLPFLGQVDPAAQSLTLTTSLIALVDGFNPCSLWVLSLLLAIVIYSGSRRKIFAVGFTFLLVTSLAYALFIAGLFNALSFVGYLGWIRIVVALIALTFALINIKDYFWYKRGLSLTISERYKPGIYRGIRRIVAAEASLPAMIGATAVMALGITLLELPCTAGFPVLWADLLAGRSLSAATFWSLLLLYMLIYLLDELIVFISAVITLKAGRFEERQGRALKLVGGTVMLALALVLLVYPDIMNQLGSSLAVMGSALFTAFFVILIDRKIRPRFGKRAGT
jgi:thiol-disulfide isomerase/thioredoxin